MDFLVDRRKDAELRHALENIESRYEKQTDEIATQMCTQPRRLFESLLFEMLSIVNGSYGCVLRLTGAELSEVPFLELVSSITRVKGGRLQREFDTLLNREPEGLVDQVVSSGQSRFANNKRSLVPKCLPDCHPTIENFAILPLIQDKRVRLVIFIANSDKVFNQSVVGRLEMLLEIFSKVYKSVGGNKQAQRTIQRFQQDHRNHSRLLDANFNGVITIGSDGLITAFNLACEKYFDVVASVALGNSASNFLSADVLDPLIMQANKFLPDAKIRDFHASDMKNSVGYRSDGSEFPIQIAAFFARVEESVSVTLVVDDISDRYESARESEQAFVQMKTLTNLAPVGILQLASDWSCQYANDMWCELSELTIEESMGNGWINAIHREDIVDVLDQMRDALCQHVIFKKELRLQQPLGSVAWVSINATATVDEQNRLSGFLVVVSDITEKHLAAERLRQLAHHDALTGLLNRMFFLDHLEDALQSVGENPSDQSDLVTLLSIDLDGFKAVNDTLGHGAGDTLLREVALRLQSAVRDKDVIARLGGDEFVVTLSEITNTNHATIVAEKILFSLKRPFFVENVELKISASIGISSTRTHSVTADELMKQADVALYRAKELGKSRAEFFTAELNVERTKQEALKENIKKLVKQRKCDLHYQPQLDIKRKQLCGFEALLRMPDSFGSDCMPAEVIEVLEDMGLIHEVGEWALMQACHDFKCWVDTGLVNDDCTISVNVSAKQLQDENFINTVIDALRQSGLPAYRLILELTESAFIGHTEETVEIINRVKALNVKVSLDDFGTGYSSLSYLSRLPIDHLKIDKSFVTNLGESEEQLAIVRAILAISNALGITVVAEGVEVPEVVSLLASEGCDSYQGYYFSRPMIADSIQEFLCDMTAPALESFA